MSLSLGKLYDRDILYHTSVQLGGRSFSCAVIKSKDELLYEFHVLDQNANGATCNQTLHCTTVIKDDLWPNNTYVPSESTMLEAIFERFISTRLTSNKQTVKAVVQLTITPIKRARK